MWTYSRGDCVLHCLIIRLGLIGTTELREQRRAGDVDSRLRDLAVADARQNARERYPDVRSLHLLHLLHGVAEHDVADLVTENAGELGHVVGSLDQTTIHVNESTRNGKRIYFVAVYDEETPIEIGTARM